MLSTTDIPLAIVGMACRLPRADSVEQYWSLLKSGGSAIGELPPERLNRRLYYDPRKSVTGKTYTSIAGIVEPRPINPTICRLPRDVIDAADESHVALCEVAAKAFFSGGHDPYNLAHRRAGVYIGHSRGSGISGQLRYATMVGSTARWLREIPEFIQGVGSDADAVIAEVIRQVRQANPHRSSNGEPNLSAHEAARMISRAFKLDGPYVSVNAACASSLMALGMGARALQLGNIDMAIIGGASHCKVDSLVLFSKAQSASATGSRPLDAEADGLVAAEGFVVFVLKTLERALSDGDRIAAVISGIGISSDGHGKSLWAPRKEGQIEAVRRAYTSSAEISRLGMIEAHATSTQLGDATELSALIEAIAPTLPPGRRIPIGSVKGNIGHALESAGAAGLLKAVLAIQHREIPPSIGVKNLNPKIDWANAPLFVPTQALPFPLCEDGGPRRTAVNSFGIGGLNAHVVVDEFQESTATTIAVPRLPQETDADIAIIGLSAILPGVRTIDELYEVVRGDVDCRSQVTPDRWNSEVGFDSAEPAIYKSVTQWGGFASDYEYDWRRHKVPPKQIAGADPLQFMLLDAVDQALKRAGLHDGNWNRARTGCIVGTRFTGEFPTQLQLGLRLVEFRETLRDVLAKRGVPANDIDAWGEKFSTLLLERMPALNDETGSFTTSTLASRITKTFDLRGGAAAIDAGDVSSEAALEICIQTLRSGQADMMICAGGQRALGLPDYEELSLRGEVIPDLPDGSLAPGSLVPGEGAAVVLLKRLADARRDGNPIIAIVKKVIRARNDEPEQALEDVLADDSTSLGKLVHVEGTIPQNQFSDRSRHIAGVEQFGHLMGGSGMVSLVKSAILAGEQPGGHATIFPTRLGDLAYRIDLENPVAEVQDSRPTEWKEFYWRAASLESLAEQLDVGDSEAAALFAKPTEKDSNTGAGWRLAIVASSPDQLRELCHLASKQLVNVSTHVALRERGIFCRQATPTKPLVAFCFPGQGSQSAGMLRELCENNPAAATELTRLNEIQQRLGLPTFGEVAWEQTELLGKDVWRTQLAMLLADNIVLACLNGVGIVPDRVVGHSYGELVALMAAKVWSTETAVQATYARCEAIGRCADDVGILLSTNAPRDRLTSLLSQSFPKVHLSALNSPLQTVVGGAKADIQLLAEALKADKFESQILRVPRPFHTPLMQGSQPYFGESLKGFAMGPARVPLLSTVNVKYVADPDDVQRNLVDQLAQPVEYQAAIERLFDEGVEVFIEVGPRQTLSQLNRQVLASKEVWLLPANHAKRPDLQQMAFVRAASWVLGLTDSYPAEPPIVVRQAISQPMELFAAANEVKPTGSTAVNVTEHVDGLTLLRLEGSPYAMGFQHGTARREEILSVLHRCVNQIDFPSKPLPSLDRSVTLAESFFGDSEREELAGIADAVKVPMASIIAYNLRVYPDLDGGCVHFAVCHNDGQSHQILHGANEDLPLSLALGDCITRNMQLRFAAGKVPYLTFAADGQLGGINGINIYGVALTSAMLLDSTEDRVARPGLLHAVVVRRVLEEAQDLDEALAILMQLRGTGAWNLCLSHFPSQQIAYVEYDASGVRSQCIEHQVVASNHSRLNPQNTVPQHSFDRLSRLKDLLGEETADRSVTLSPTRAKTALRDRFDVRRGKAVAHATMNTVCRVDNQISLLMRPATGDMWVTRGSEVDTAAEEYVKLDLKKLFGGSWRDEPVRNEKKNSPPAEVHSKPTANVEITWPEFIAKATSLSDEPPLGNPSDTCQRFAMRLLRQPLAIANEENRLARGAVLLGTGPLVEVLKSQLDRLKIPVLAIDESESMESACEKLRAAWQCQPLLNLFVLTPHSPAAMGCIEHGAWQQRRTPGVMLPYLLCQEWVKLVLEADAIDRASVVAALRLGGDFGFVGEAPSAESGALCGLLKGLTIEYTRAQQKKLRVRLVDFDEPAEPADMATNLFAEVEAEGYDVEVAYRYGVRYVVRPVLSPVKKGQPVKNPSGQWIVTGGARGVTAVVARELGQRFGLTLHLIGTSSIEGVDPAWCRYSADELKTLKTQIMRERFVPGEPPIRAWQKVEKSIEVLRTIEALRGAGVKAHYYACDISDFESLDALVKRIRSEHGPISGIVHGAGFESACRFDRKKRGDIERTLAVKVDGAVNLLEATVGDPLEFFLAFGSISGRFGGMGQTDYCMANDLLAKLVGRLRSNKPDCHATLFHWHSWDEVGMAVRPESKHIKDLHGIRFMPTREGARHFVDEILAGTPENEVLITDWQYYKRFYPDPIVAPSMPEAPVEIKEEPSSVEVAPRHVLRMVPAPLGDSSARFTPTGACLIWGQGARARELQMALQASGAGVEVLPHDASVIQRVSQICSQGLARHLFLLADELSTGEDALDPTRWQKRRQSNVELPFLILQQWLRLLPTDCQRASVVAVTSLGGDFGLRNKPFVPESGVLAGLLKSVHVETTLQAKRPLTVKVLDFASSETPPFVAEQIIAELSTDSSYVEFGYLNSRRHRVMATRQKVSNTQAKPISRGGVWLVTGGARGFTAQMLARLAGEHDLRVHLVGSSSVPTADAPWRCMSQEELKAYKRQVTQLALASGRTPHSLWEPIQADIEIQANLDVMRAIGIEAHYHSCDVGDFDALANIIAQIREISGPITGIIHGAGVRHTARLEQITAEQLHQSIRAKVDGAVALTSLTRQDPIEHFVSFGSLGGRFGANGGADYAMVNEALAKITSWYRHERPDCSVVTIHWHAVEGVGMMTRPQSFGPAAIQKLQLMSVDEAYAHMLREITAGCPESEILTTDGEYHSRFYPEDAVSEDSPQAHDEPALIRSGQDGPWQLTLDPVRDVFLREHRFKGKPLLPMVAGIEALAEAANDGTAAKYPLELQNVRVHQPFKFFTDEPVEARVIETLRDEATELTLVADFKNRKGQVIDPNRRYISATAHRRVDKQTQRSIALPEKFNRAWYPDDELAIYHGPSFRCVTQAATAEVQGWTRIVAPHPNVLNGPNRRGNWLVPSVVLDGALFSCGIYFFIHRPGTVTIPLGIEQLVVFGVPAKGEECLCHYMLRSATEDRAFFDFVILDSEGNELMMATNYEAALFCEGQP